MVYGRLRRLLEEPSPLWELIRKDQLRDLLEQNSPWPWYGQLMRGPQTAAYFLQLDHWLKYYAPEFRF